MDITSHQHDFEIVLDHAVLELGINMEQQPYNYYYMYSNCSQLLLQTCNIRTHPIVFVLIWDRAI